MIRTYLDAGVLITAARGVAPIALKAMKILDDPNREFASSIFLKLEVLPKAVYYKNEAEAEFYDTFFNIGPTLLIRLREEHSERLAIQDWLQWMHCT
jgi:hypothetical protein